MGAEEGEGRGRECLMGTKLQFGRMAKFFRRMVGTAAQPREGTYCYELCTSVVTMVNFMLCVFLSTIKIEKGKLTSSAHKLYKNRLWARCGPQAAVCRPLGGPIRVGSGNHSV